MREEEWREEGKAGCSYSQVYSCIQWYWLQCYTAVILTRSTVGCYTWSGGDVEVARFIKGEY